MISFSGSSVESPSSGTVVGVCCNECIDMFGVVLIGLDGTLGALGVISSPICKLARSNDSGAIPVAGSRMFIASKFIAQTPRINAFFKFP